jgi:hypothetical protein
MGRQIISLPLVYKILPTATTATLQTAKLKANLSVQKFNSVQRGMRLSALHRGVSVQVRNGPQHVQLYSGSMR